MGLKLQAFSVKQMITPHWFVRSYAARSSPTYGPYHRLSSRSHSRSPSPPCGTSQIKFITSFGDDSEAEGAHSEAEGGVIIIPEAESGGATGGGLSKSSSSVDRRRQCSSSSSVSSSRRLKHRRRPSSSSRSVNDRLIRRPSR